MQTVVMSATPIFALLGKSLASCTKRKSYLIDRAMWQPATRKKSRQKSILLSGVTVHPLSICEVFLTKFLFFDKAQKSSDVELTMAKKVYCLVH